MLNLEHVEYSSCINIFKKELEEVLAAGLEHNIG